MFLKRKLRRSYDFSFFECESFECLLSLLKLFILSTDDSTEEKRKMHATELKTEGNKVSKYIYASIMLLLFIVLSIRLSRHEITLLLNGREATIIKSVFYKLSLPMTKVKREATQC